jgi:hypothetical protein
MPSGHRTVIALHTVLRGAKEARAFSLLATPAREGNAHFSPDGRWLAYESTESGQKAIVVRRFPSVST